MSAKQLDQCQEHLLARWVLELDNLQLECDGMTRVLSTLLQRHNIDHRVMVGGLVVKEVGDIPYHWWIVLPGGRILDLRARMWLGDDERVPHGIFIPDDTQAYESRGEIEPASIRLPAFLFQALTSRSIEA